MTTDHATSPPDPPAPAVPVRRQFRHATAFAVIAAVLVTFLAASSAPSPLYVVYQEQWGFSPTTLTVVFAVYVFALLGSLLVVGALSDHVGRRPVIAGALVVEALSLLLFTTASSVELLALARIVQGLATGAALSTLGATLVDLDPPHAPGRAGVISSVAPFTGLALGALGCGLLVQLAPSPTHLVYDLLLVAMVIALAVVAFIPETVAPRPGAWRSLVPKARVPARLRADVLGITPILVASWALGGLYLSLGPSVAAAIFDLHSHLIGGVVVALLTGTGAATAFVLRGRSASELLRTAAVVLGGGMVVTVAAVAGGSAFAAAIGTVIAGVGFGAAGLASFGTLARIASPEERGELFAVAFVISYVAFSVPALVAGLAAQHYGLRDTALVYGGFIVLLCVLATAAQRAIAHRAERALATA